MKHLAILLNDDLNGVTTFNYTLLKKIKADTTADELFVYFLNTSSTGFAHQFAGNQFTVLTEIDNQVTYDYVYLNNRAGLKFAMGTVSATSWKFITHSIMTEDALPILNQHLSQSIDVFTLSQKSQDYLTSLGHTPTQTVNGIDLTRFASASPSSAVKKLLVFDVRNNAFYREKILNICALIPQLYVRVLDVPTWDIEQEIAQADMVIAYGRSAIESMAMGKSVIIYGVNGGDGIVNPVTYDSIKASNFSGWSIRNMPNPEDLAEFHIAYEISRFDTGEATAVRDLIRGNYDIATTKAAILGE